MKHLRLVVMLMLAVCGVASLGAQAPQPWAFVRHTDGIPVVDSAGTVVAQPFLRGFDVPRPQLVDIDGDGDLDLFVQERGDELMLFERIGQKYVWRTDRFHDLDVGEWFRFVDLDADGDVDLMGELRNSYIRVWRNDGTRGAPKFIAMSDSLRDVDDKAIFADQQNILNTVDVDCNGKLDLFIGRVSGTIDRYEEDGRDRHGIPRFRFLTERWQDIEIIGAAQVGGSASRPSLHGANTMAFADVDADGDPDLYWGDFFEPGLLLIENRGTCDQPDFGSTPVQFPGNGELLTSGYNAPTFGDTDGDGDLDLVMGVIGGAFQPSRSSIDNIYHVEQIEPNKFVVRTSRLLATLDVGSESTPTLADIDGDGDLDLMIANKMSPTDSDAGTITRFENVGTAQSPSFRDRGVIAGQYEYHSAPAFADLDGDRRVDLITGSWRDRVRWHRNTGPATAPNWILADSALFTLTRGSNSTPTFGDLDGDGDLDAMVGEASGELNLFRNIGDRTSPRFELVSDIFQGIDVGRRSTPVLVDMDRDGKLDIVLGSENGTVELWRNVGTAASAHFALDSTFTQSGLELSAPAAGDLDADGDVDLVVGVAGGGVVWLENKTREH